MERAALFAELAVTALDADPDRVHEPGRDPARDSRLGLGGRAGLGGQEVLEEVGRDVAGAELLVGEHALVERDRRLDPRPSIWNSRERPLPSARSRRSRSGAQTISLAISES